MVDVTCETAALSVTTDGEKDIFSCEPDFHVSYKLRMFRSSTWTQVFDFKTC